MEQRASVFREKSLARVSSPEQLNDYLRVTSPSVWLILLAVILLLAGGLVWAVLGTLETTVRAEAMVQGGTAMLLLPQGERPENYREGMTVRINGAEGRVTRSGYTQSGQSAVSAEIPLADGYYSAEIVTETVSPIRFLFAD